MRKKMMCHVTEKCYHLCSSQAQKELGRQDNIIYEEERETFCLKNSRDRQAGLK